MICFLASGAGSRKDAKKGLRASKDSAEEARVKLSPRIPGYLFGYYTYLGSSGGLNFDDVLKLAAILVLLGQRKKQKWAYVLKIYHQGELISSYIRPGNG